MAKYFIRRYPDIGTSLIGPFDTAGAARGYAHRWLPTGTWTLFVQTPDKALPHWSEPHSGEHEIAG